MPWQRYVADVSHEVDPATGLLWYREVIVEIPRQSGKTTLGLTVRVHRATGPFGGPQMLLYTAQTRTNRATGVITSIPVGSVTTVVNGTATAITTPVSAMADVSGAVTVSTLSGSSTVTSVVTDASVQALQTLTGGPTIELGNQAVDATLGTYRFRLPVAAPVKAAYASSTTALTFTADAAAAGKYSIVAQSPGRAAVTKPADISAGTAAIVNFNWGP